MAKETKFTLLHRHEGWSNLDMERIAVSGLPTGVRGHPKYPKHLLLEGHFTKEEVSAALSHEGFSIRNVSGTRNLPFCPPNR